MARKRFGGDTTVTPLPIDHDGRSAPKRAYELVVAALWIAVFGVVATFLML